MVFNTDRKELPNYNRIKKNPTRGRGVKNITRGGSGVGRGRVKRVTAPKIGNVEERENDTGGSGGLGRGGMRVRGSGIGRTDYRRKF